MARTSMVAFPNAGGATSTCLVYVAAHGGHIVDIVDRPEVPGSKGVRAGADSGPVPGEIEPVDTDVRIWTLVPEGGLRFGHVDIRTPNCLTRWTAV